MGHTREPLLANVISLRRTRIRPLTAARALSAAVSSIWCGAALKGHPGPVTSPRSAARKQPVRLQAFGSRRNPLCADPACSSRLDQSSGPARILLILMLLMSAGCLHRHKTVAIQTYPPPVPSNPPAAPKAPQPSAPSGAAAAPSSPGGQLPQNLPGEEGIASWYGPPFNGRASASGEIYNMYDFTAAHRTLPFGTQVRVHNLDNGQTVDVRINDRGPFIEGRIIDLSYSAAEALHMIGPGTAQVRLEILNPGLIAGPAAEPGIFAVQVGAFRNLDNAEQMKARLQNQFGPVVIQSFDRGNGLFHRVRVGHESTEEAAHVLETQLQQAGIARQTFVVRLN